MNSALVRETSLRLPPLVSAQRPTRADYYWFVHHLLFTALLVLSIGWSLLPTRPTSTHVPVQVLLDVLPQRRWVLVLQCLWLLGMMFAYCGLNLYAEDVLTPPLDSQKTVVDAAGGPGTSGTSGTSEDTPNSNNSLFSESSTLEYIATRVCCETSGVEDLPLMDVCDVLYSSVDGSW
ncbi:phosphatidylinositol N-acetylglucosaminyltransferase GPI19 KNAG_0C03100 [Huiozyma naganishii CBS 8797]|uniref:PIG-P domain-containing protein n=1 Tax=Huiozyma naganishii (strain ATCC MYA-139 / BCRC 22969 / CBS 8797 / KCTC 17520 / NBRC 10181 / NCYC 3082 / Yp74L-3) TaxID=1071383 RepID=J7S5X7_HUIN7|nr:hypothetical protein KNAG_0C03100 [Kazachstania naganishii CBS 8797]CCK69421.1 hypothetical protein KNAG_0C03100 [Kazachstania naganishii CBS 8797]